MIRYDPQAQWKAGLVFRYRGSVFPKSMGWASMAAAVAFGLKFVLLPDPNVSTSQVWAGYNFVVGFLLVFRTQQSYSRFWEAATILQQVRGEWFNASSSCMAFCTRKQDRKTEVEQFQHLMIRLMSLLYCTALQQVAVLEDEAFIVFDLEGLSPESLDYLAQAPEKCVVVMQWIHRLIILSMDNGVLDVPPAVLSRAFQQLSQGIVLVTNAQKITDIPFPFPYTQLVTLILLVTTVVTPILNCMLVESRIWCVVMTFIPVFALWSLDYIASEIEMPLGDDTNDLPVYDLQIGMNNSLNALLDELCQTPPTFVLSDDEAMQRAVYKCPGYLITEDQHLMGIGESSSLQTDSRGRWTYYRGESQTLSQSSSIVERRQREDESGTERVEWRPSVFIDGNGGGDIESSPLETEDCKEMTQQVKPQLPRIDSPMSRGVSPMSPASKSKNGEGLLTPGGQLARARLDRALARGPSRQVSPAAAAPPHSADAASPRLVLPTAAAGGSSASARADERLRDFAASMHGLLAGLVDDDRRVGDARLVSDQASDLWPLPRARLDGPLSGLDLVGTSLASQNNSDNADERLLDFAAGMRVLLARLVSGRRAASSDLNPSPAPSRPIFPRWSVQDALGPPKLFASS